MVISTKKSSKFTSVLPFSKKDFGGQFGRANKNFSEENIANEKPSCDITIIKTYKMSDFYQKSCANHVDALIVFEFGLKLCENAQV